MLKYSIIISFLSIINFSVSAQSVEIIDVEDMESIIHEKTGKTRVINFWATWCKPCIEELPYFEAVNQSSEFEDIEVILISLDFAEDIDTKVKKYIEKKSLTSTVKLLDNVDYNSWIDKVDPSWSGAIPATLVVNNSVNKRIFFEKQFEESELQNVLKNFEKEINQTNR